MKNEGWKFFEQAGWTADHLVKQIDACKTLYPSESYEDARKRALGYFAEAVKTIETCKQEKQNGTL